MDNKNGNKREEGNWKGSRWVGAYKSYYENGNLRNDFTYNTNGEKSGIQKYYYESGQLQIQGEWKQGQESGKIVEYYENGSVKCEKTFNNGEFVGEQTYEKKEKPAEPVVASKQVTPAKVALNEDTVAADSAQQAKVVKKAKPASLKDLNGQQEILDRDGRVSKTGEFKNGFLIEGKKFEYDPAGKLIKTFIVKKGKVVKVIDHQQEKKKG